MTRLRTTLRCSLLGLLMMGTVAAHAQTPPDTPEAMAEAFLTAFRDTDWERCAALMHPDALEDFKGILMEIAEIDSSGAFVQMFFGEDAGPDVLAETPPDGVFRQFIAAIMEEVPMMGAMLGGLDAEIIGHVEEGDSLAHVVSRNRIDVMGAQFTQMEVISLRRYEGGWRLLLTGDMENMVTVFRQQFMQDF